MRASARALRVLCGLLLVAAGHQQAPRSSADPGRLEDEAVGLGAGYRPPQFTASDLDGQVHSLASYQGHVLVLHFWASWCPYCRGEIPELTQLYQEWASKGVRVLAVSTDQDVAKLRRFVGTTKLPYPVVADAAVPSSVAKRYGISGVPVTYIVTRNGRIASRLSGSGDILGAVQRALEQAPST